MTLSKKRLFLAGLILAAPLSRSQSGYEKNAHVRFSIGQEGGSYLVRYTFKDHLDNLVGFTMYFPSRTTRTMIDRFGIPKSMFKRFVVTDETLRKREETLRNGMFKNIGNTLLPDKSALVNYYGGLFCRPVALLIQKALEHMGKDSRIDRINMAMKFVQDIPYGIPKEDNGSVFNGGVITPPEVLMNMYGDCDSKAIFFAGILCYLISPDDIIFVGEPKHILTAIKNKPEHNQVYLDHDGDTYVIAETAGPGRFPFGNQGEHFKGSVEIEPLVFRPEGPAADGERNTFTVTPIVKLFKVFFQNRCNFEIRLLLSIDQPPAGGWYTLRPGKKEFVLETPSRHFLFYAEGKKTIWSGSMPTIFEGREYVCKRVEIADIDEGDFVMQLECN